MDTAARRHRYGVGTPPPGSVSLELGALHTERREDSVPVWLAEDRVVVDGGVACRAGDRPPGRARAGPPRRSRGAARVRCCRERGPPHAARWTSCRAGGDGADAPRRRAHPHGYLWSSDAPNRRELHLAIHPVTGDQLLTPWPREALDMGYGEVTRLGWVSTVPFTEAREPRHVDVPWASRFGRRVRRS